MKPALLTARLAALFLFLLPPLIHAAEGKERRIVVIAGNNIGDSGEEPLGFAESDARRMHAVFLQLGGVKKTDMLLRIGGRAPEILADLRKASQIARSARAANQRVTLFFYFSGHGDNETLHLPRGNLALSSLRQAIRAIPADLKVTLLDACRTSRAARGIRKAPAFQIAVTPRGPQGYVELRASAAGEPAQESRELGGSLFTNYLVSALRGAADVNRDNRITLAEAYSYLYHKTLARSAHGGSLQHPTITQQTTGAGELVVSRLARAAARLEIPAGDARYLVFTARSGIVLAEISGQAGAKVALPAGKYIITRLRGDNASVAEVDLSWGGVVRISPRAFRRVARESLARRGVLSTIRPLSLGVRGGPELCLGCADDLTLRAGVQLIYARGGLMLGLELASFYGGVEAASTSGSQAGIIGGAFVGWRHFLGLVTLTGLAGAEFRYAWQSTESHEAERARRANLPWSRDMGYGAVASYLGLRLGLPLNSRFSLVTTIAGGALFRNETDGKSRGLAPKPVFFPSLGLFFAL